MKKELKISEAFAIVSIGGDLKKSSQKITEEYENKISKSIDDIFDLSDENSKNYNFNVNEREFKINLTRKDNNTGHTIEINENIADMETRKTTYGIYCGKIFDEVLGIDISNIEVPKEQKIAVCKIIEECAKEEQIRKYEKSIRDIFDQVDDTFSFLNESTNEGGSINKKFDKPSGDILVKLGGGNAYIFPRSKNEKAYTLSMGHDSSGELHAIRKPLELFTYKKIFDELIVAVQNNKSK